MIKSITYKITNMHCASCAMNIDGELEDTEGVLEAATNFAKGVSRVKFDEEKIMPEQLVKIINKTGYNAVPE